MRMKGSEVKSEQTAPIVQHEYDFDIRPDLIHNVENKLRYLADREPSRFRIIETWQGESHAPVRGLKVLNLLFPYFMGIRPAMQHDNGVGAIAIDIHRYARGYYFTVHVCVSPKNNSWVLPTSNGSRRRNYKHCSSTLALMASVTSRRSPSAFIPWRSSCSISLGISSASMP